MSARLAGGAHRKDNSRERQQRHGSRRQLPREDAVEAIREERPEHLQSDRHTVSCRPGVSPSSQAGPSPRDLVLEMQLVLNCQRGVFDYPERGQAVVRGLNVLCQEGVHLAVILLV